LAGPEVSNRLLREIGEVLYGPRWQSELSRELGVSDRTVRRWIAGAEEAKQGVYVDLWRLLEERAAALDDVLERTKAAANRT
jgi:predicted transcriptional regulator